MHVAVCDDNIADRKQTERLLNRESDRRAKMTEGLFIDSYGNETALLTKPMQYDIFYIDMCKTDGTTGEQVAQKLCAAGIQVPIYMCCSDVDYRQFDLPENVHFLDKPLKIDELIASLDYAEETKASAVSLIELRDDSETFYVKAEDIMYAVQKARKVRVALTDGHQVILTSDIANIYAHWSGFDCFLVPNSKTIVNAAHIGKIGLLNITMTDGTKFLSQGIERGSLQELMTKYKL